MPLLFRARALTFRSGLAAALAFVLALGGAADLAAQPVPTRSVPRQAYQHSRDHASVREVFTPLVAPLRHAVVAVYRDGRQVALGTVVDSSGLILTKASELDAGSSAAPGPGRGGEPEPAPEPEPEPESEPEPDSEPQPEARPTVGSGKAAGTSQIEVGVPGAGGEQRHRAERVAVDEDNDLALLRIEAKGLTAVRLAVGSELRVGSFLASAGPAAAVTAPLAIGVMSVPPHPRRLTPFLGVRSEAAEAGEAGLRLVEVVAGSAAAAAGLRIGDVIVRFAGQQVGDHAALVAAIAARAAGEEVEVELRRDGGLLRLPVGLGRRSDRHGPISQQERGRLWGPLSRVRLGFTEVIQHDSVLRPDQCGGPLVDLDGSVVGINIARVGRVETIAVTARIVAAFLDGIEGLPRERRRVTR